jgi:pseudaminic acid cytidylyltransferase
MKIAIIPARGGSKRIPGKNIKPFLGKPIIAYSIQAALDSGVFDRVVVSTDSEKITEIAKEYGAEVPFYRPGELCDDHTATAPVITHALEWFIQNNSKPDYACCIYATAPFLKPEYIKEGYEKISNNNCSSCYSITTFPFPIFRALRINEKGTLEMYWPEHELTRSQDLEAAYHDAGQFYWVNTEKFLKNPKLYANDSLPVVMPRYLVQDIDTMEDWKMAEYLFKAIHAQET